MVSSLWKIIALVLICAHAVRCALWKDNVFYNNVNASYAYSYKPPTQDMDDSSMFRQARRSAASDACTTNEGTSGTCLSRFNCMRQGGIPKGYCSTYGVCCETNLQCGQISSSKRIIIKNPVQLPTVCQYVITPYSSNVCQLLIEFEQFELNQPTNDATLGTSTCGDRFLVGDFTLCGENSGQHIYLPYDVAAGATQVTLEFSFPTKWAQSSWNLIVTQLECPQPKKRFGASSMVMPFMGQTNLQDLRKIFSAKHSDWELLAPPGCSQYFRQPTGTIKSFGDIYYMENLHYTICIRPLPGPSVIEYTVNRFSLSSEQTDNFYDENCHPLILTDGRQNDYLMIWNAMFKDDATMQPTYFCGQALSAGQELVATAPYQMYFNSDDQWSSVETGFSISYRVKSAIS
uniref:CUB domain-containing protein n=1 Tax=Bactrocera latifrons TaxID=174628 RepID=A0A0K8VXW4_BACLA